MELKKNNLNREIFRAIHEGKWLKIEYKNKSEQITKYWIGIKDIDLANRSLQVEGLHLGLYTLEQFNKIYIDSIVIAEVVEGTYYEKNMQLIEDISMHPEKYVSIFGNAANVKVLNYLELCNKMDCTPYITDYTLVKYLDADSFVLGKKELSEEQFRQIVNEFQYNKNQKKSDSGALRMKRLALNVLSIHTQKGLYVLAYRKLNLNVKNKTLCPEEDITICTQFTIDGLVESIRKYLDADDYELLNDFEGNQEKIKDIINQHGSRKIQVDDMPYLIGIGTDIALDLHSEYKAILDMYQQKSVTFPIKAFFGEVLERPRRTKAFPIALLNQNINLDQLLAINNAMKYPCAYIQGPPGTGKTNTIKNTLVTAFFNEKTVLFASYNNIPIDGVFNSLTGLMYKDKTIPFPILRLGNRDKLDEAIRYINELRLRVKNIIVYENTLDKRKGSRKERAKLLSGMLKDYEERLDLEERKATLEHLNEYQLQHNNSMSLIPFQMDLQSYQLQKLEERMKQIRIITNEDALELLDHNEDEFYEYLYYVSAQFIQKIESDRYADLRRILEMSEREKQIFEFSKYLRKSENVRKLQKIFPIIVTTCISAHRLGQPEPLFDMTIMDEASQCNVAISLVPIIRGEQLMLVGDPQQLKPVVLLDDITNKQLRKRYHVANEYDYKDNSIYKTYLACDAVSDEVLLHHHYRCNKKIIGFNNKKYYHSKLNVESKSCEQQPLVLVNVQDSKSHLKNTSPAEVDEIISYAVHHKDKDIAVITPFVNQRKLIEEQLKECNINNVVCGTVHAFQGDEKDVILFSTALSERTTTGTYGWLKNNKELINVATSRAKDKLIVLANGKELERLHADDKNDDLYELVQYVKTNGQSHVTEKHTNSRALGVQPFSTKTESAFMENLTHALENIWLSQSRYVIHKEVAISHVFHDNITYDNLFYMGRFDFVIYEKKGDVEIPIFAIELDGKEHYEDEVVMARDAVKNKICHAHNLQVIRVENSYARRYTYIKSILLDYFSRKH